MKKSKKFNKKLTRDANDFQEIEDFIFDLLRLGFPVTNTTLPMFYAVRFMQDKKFGGMTRKQMASRFCGLVEILSKLVDRGVIQAVPANFSYGDTCYGLREQIINAEG